MAAKTVCESAIRGFICESAFRAVIQAAAIRQKTNTQPRIFRNALIRSLNHSKAVKIGRGVIQMKLICNMSNAVEMQNGRNTTVRECVKNKAHSLTVVFLPPIA